MERVSLFLFFYDGVVLILILILILCVGFVLVIYVIGFL